MKLRIRGDSLRLRLSQSDVRQLAESGRVAETVHFPGGATLQYAVARDDAEQALDARMNGSSVEIAISPQWLHRWAQSDEVSLSHRPALADGRHLTILVEKDFRCLTPRDGEEDGDAFPNPNSTC